MQSIRKIEVSTGVWWVEVPAADIRVLCGCPADAVKHLILCRVERRPPRLDLAIYPYLPRATVEKTSAKAYMRLLSPDAGEAA